MFVQVQACTCASTPSGNTPHAYASRSRLTLTLIRSEVKSTVIGRNASCALGDSRPIFFRETRFVNCSCII